MDSARSRHQELRWRQSGFSVSTVRCDVRFNSFLKICLLACPRATITEHLSLLPLLPAVLTFHPLLSIFIFRAPYKLPNTHPETHPPRPSNHSKSESICFCSPHLSPPCPGCFFIWHLLDCWCMDLWMLLAAMKLYSEFGSRTGSLPKQ